MRILITGGAGFIGSHLAEHFSKENEVIILDDLSNGRKENLSGIKARLVVGKIEDKQLLRKICKKIDYIFHEAALSGVQQSMENPELTIETNIKGTLNLLEEALSAGVKKIVFASSASVYGDNSINPKTEELPQNPLSPYAISKLCGEHFMKMFYKEYGLRTTCLRYFNVFGKRQNPNSPYAAAIPIFIKKALEGKEITIFGDGNQTRDFVYVKDVVKANALALEKGDGETYNICTGKETTINNLAEEIISITKSKSKIIHLEGRKGEIRKSVGDWRKAKKELGWTPEFSLKKGLFEMIS